MQVHNHSLQEGGRGRDLRGKMGIIKILENFNFLNWALGKWLCILLFSKVSVYVFYTLL